MKAGAVLFAHDLKGMLGFYVSVAELRVVRTSEDHAVLESSNFQLIIHESSNAARAAGERDTAISRREAAIKLVFPVRDLAVSQAAAEQHGGPRSAGCGVAL